MVNIVDLFPNVSYNIFPFTNYDNKFDIFLPRPKNDVSEFLNNVSKHIIESKQRQNTFLNRGIDRVSKSEGYEKYLQVPNTRLSNLAKEITKGSHSNDEKMYKIEQWVLNNIDYEYDIKNYGQDEWWAYPTMTLNKGTGDCVANYEEIWTDCGLKKVGDLEIGDIVLSYDFSKREYCYKPITKIWEKGILPVFRVKFRNGTWIDVTEDHPFWTRQFQSKSTYEKTKLHDIDLSRWWKRKIPCVKKLPYEVKDIEWLTEDLCFVVGHFLAEGDIGGSHVRTSGYDIPEYIIPILNNNNIPYSISTNNSGVPYLSFLKSKFKDYLKRQKDNSFNIHLDKELLSLPENKLQAILDGHFIGDGHHAKYAENSNREKIYSTSSDQLAFDIQRIHLQLGKPIHMWWQEHHGGTGKKPIWRLNYNTNSYFNKDYGYEGISETSIKSIEPIGETEVRDFEIKGTHTFISKFGHLCHNCEDFSFLIMSLGLHAGVDPSRLRMYGGLVQVEEGSLELGGHGWTAYKREADNEWISLDGTYYTTDKPIDERIKLKDDKRYVEDFWYIVKDGVVDASYSNRIRNPDVPNNIYGQNGGLKMDINNIVNNIDYKVQPMSATNKDRDTKVNQIPMVSNEDNKAEKIRTEYLNSIDKGRNINIKI